MSDYTIDTKIREIQREIAMRKALYPKWVAAGKMKADHAEQKIAVMQAILDDYMEDRDEPTD